jgi:plastocyanin
MSHIASYSSSTYQVRKRPVWLPVSRRAIVTCVTLFGLAISRWAIAADIALTVDDREGHGVADVVVTLVSTSDPEPQIAHRPSAVMDQKNLEFVPRVLVVGTGTRVDFPNTDTVSHQVYSFSATKRFQLPLYKGTAHKPITFDRPGLVVLGCNIHDSMVGYIYVTEAPHFGTTDGGGAIKFSGLPDGDYRVEFWSPFIADPPESMIREVHLERGLSTTVRVQLRLALRAQPEPRPHRRDWDY